MDPVRVILADDDDLILRALSDVISTDTTIDLVGTARDTEEAIELTLAESPDVALLDVRMPGGGGMQVARQIRRRSPETHVVAFSGHQETETVLAMVRAGAIGFVAKEHSIEDVVHAIHRAAQGHATFSVDPVGDVAERLAEFQLHRKTAAVQASSDRIESAIESGALQMVFQPIVELSSERIVGLEALARFATRPRRSPAAWFAEAARVGLLVDLELVAVQRALSHVHLLPDDVYLSVNVSPETLGSASLLELLRPSIVERIVLEMTEQTSVEDYDDLERRLRSIRDLGVRLAIDDVGAGYASLRHVVSLTPDLMKIDRALVTDIDSDPMRGALMERLVSFANEVGVGVIAEGVEDERELAVLRSLDVPYAQGFHLGRPGPIPSAAGGRPLEWPGRGVNGSRSPRP